MGASLEASPLEGVGKDGVDHVDDDVGCLVGISLDHLSRGVRSLLEARNDSKVEGSVGALGELGEEDGRQVLELQWQARTSEERTVECISIFTKARGVICTL